MELENELKVVKRISWRLAQRLPMPLEDCYGYGCLGLMKALKRIDVRKYPEEAQYWAYLIKRIEGAIIDGYRYEWAWFKPWEKGLYMELMSDQEENRLGFADSRTSAWDSLLTKRAANRGRRSDEVCQGRKREFQGLGEGPCSSGIPARVLDLLGKAETIMEDLIG